MEAWLPIEEFPGYEVSSYGRVRNEDTGHVLGVYDNGHGVRQVVMRRNRHPTARAVHRLVATAFLHPPPFEDSVPMHIDGDWGNNAADNLIWKPRWFAVKHTRQAKQEAPRDTRPIRMIKTMRVYPNALECAKDIGGLESLVLLTAQNRHGARYMGSAFEFVYE